MAVTKKGVRYKLELWIDENGDVEDSANAYPVYTRPAEGTLSVQEETKQVAFTPSTELKALLKSEQSAPVSAELSK